jgi:hypothetical protein
MQPVIVASDLYGSSNYAFSNGDGSLTQQQELTRSQMGNPDRSYSNGVGDFNNDGVLDVVLAVGNEAGITYLFGRIENGQFVEQNSDIQGNRGRYPGKMAVADFDEDGNLDFIMTYDGSIDCDLYKGNGKMEFTPIELRDTAPKNSIGADSGDFNGDGHADFVTVSYTWGQTYINLGNGDGTFTSTVDCLNQDNYGYTSVAAGDFNNDGFDDIAVSHSLSSVDIYRYYSDVGIFGYRHRISKEYFYTSPVDTYDLNDDGHQDLIIGGYYDGASLGGIAVMIGNGNETFNDPVAYSGASHGLRMITCISAPTLYPADGIANIDPVAAIFCDPPEVIAGQTIVVDGIDSYDEDGEIVSYEWDFGDGMKAKSLEVQHGGAEVEHVYYDVGEYTITLTVTDDQGATATDQFTVQVSAVSASMRILPRMLNLKSRGQTMYAWVHLPQGCDATQVDVSAIEVIEDGVPNLVNLENSKRDLQVRTHRWLAKRNKFFVKFDRQATINAISGPSSETVIRISGEALCNGDFVDYSADDTIRTIEPRKKKKRHWWWNWIKHKRDCKKRH